MEKTYLMMSRSKVKEKWDCENFISEGDNSCGLTWPPKYYNCSFCKREFKSAQALGGHMNVHRRDRARLRLLPPPALEYRNPNPSFSSSSLSSSSSKFLLPCTIPTPLLSPSLTASFSSPSSAFTNEEKKRLLECPQEDASSTPPCRGITKKNNMRAASVGGELKGYAQKCELEVRKKGKVISLDLEIGLKDTKEVLDLELRLGYY